MHIPTDKIGDVVGNCLWAVRVTCQRSQNTLRYFLTSFATAVDCFGGMIRTRGEWGWNSRSKMSPFHVSRHVRCATKVLNGSNFTIGFVLSKFPFFMSLCFVKPKVLPYIWFVGRWQCWIFPRRHSGRSQFYLPIRIEWIMYMRSAGQVATVVLVQKKTKIANSSLCLVRLGNMTWVKEMKHEIIG